MLKPHAFNVVLCITGFTIGLCLAISADKPDTQPDDWNTWRAAVVAEMLTMDTNQSETQLEELVADYTELGQRFNIDPLWPISLAYYESRWNACCCNKSSGKVRLYCVGDLQVQNSHGATTAHERRVWAFKRIRSLLDKGRSLSAASIDWQQTRDRAARLYHKLLTKLPEPASICTDDRCVLWSPPTK